MCAAVVPIISAIAGATTIASQLGIIGNRNRSSTPTPTRSQTPPPSVRPPGPPAMGALDDEKLKKPDESIKIKQNAKQKRDKQTVAKGLSGLGAAPAVNTGVNETPNLGINV
jgi:hypothetical protein